MSYNELIGAVRFSGKIQLGFDSWHNPAIAPDEMGFVRQISKAYGNEYSQKRILALFSHIWILPFA